MRKALVRGMVKLSFVTVSSFTLLAATPSSVAATTFLNTDDSPGFQQQIPSQSGTGPVHIAGNAGTGDASRHSKGDGSKGSKNGGGTDSSGSKSKSGNSGSRGAGSKSGQSGQKAGTDSSNDAGDSGHSGSRGDNSGDSTDGDRTGTTGTTAAGGTSAGTTTFDTKTVDGLTVRTETTTFVDGSRIFRIFRNDVLFRTIEVGAGQGTPSGVLGSQQAPAGQGALGSATTPSVVAGQQSAPTIAMLPATTPAAPAAPLGILGASLVAAGAWLLRRGRQA